MEINGILREELAAQGRDPGAVLTQGVKATLRRAMFKRIDRFVVVGQAIADDLVATCRVDPSRIRVIGNGVSTERFKPMEKTEACGRLQLDPTRARLIFVGNLVGWRDFDTLLSATTLSARNVPGLELVLVGDGAERRRLEEAASHLPPSTVLFAGEVPHAQVPNYIGSSDICLLPERARGLDISPLKLFEYMSCKRPIVAFAVKGLELVETLGVGVLVRPNEPDMLSEALVSLLNDPVRRKEMGDRARTFVERERTWRRVASEISKVLDEAVGVAS
jgi:glycosyltransferase involved in cell wall biosynthesis